MLSSRAQREHGRGIRCDCLLLKEQLRLREQQMAAMRDLKQSVLTNELKTKQNQIQMVGRLDQVAAKGTFHLR